MGCLDSRLQPGSEFPTWAMGGKKLSRKKKKKKRKSKPDGSSEAFWFVSSLELPSKIPWAGLGIQLSVEHLPNTSHVQGSGSVLSTTKQQQQTHRLGGLNEIYFLTLRGWESKLKGPAGDGAFSLCPPAVPLHSPGWCPICAPKPPVLTVTPPGQLILT